jgi:hypothetical protein
VTRAVECSMGISVVKLKLEGVPPGRGPNCHF